MGDIYISILSSHTLCIPLHPEMSIVVLFVIISVINEQYV